MIASERETTVVTSDADDLVHIWTAQRRHITRLRKDPAFIEVDSGNFDGSEWASFVISADIWSPAGVRRSRRMTEEQKTRAREQLLRAKDMHNVAENTDEYGTPEGD